jgi:acetoin utilization protein AcuB
MFINKSMTRNVITIRGEAGLFEAKEKMELHNIRHLPVVTADHVLAGVITDRDIRSALPSAFTLHMHDPQEVEGIANLKVKDVMSKNPITISPMNTLGDALLLMNRARKGALPVVDKQGNLTGIISTSDVIRSFINVLGIEQPGTLLCILAEEKVGEMKKIVDAITEEGISFGSILVAKYGDEGKRAVYPYLLTNNVAGVKKKLESMGFTLLDPSEWSLDKFTER